MVGAPDHSIKIRGLIYAYSQIAVAVGDSSADEFVPSHRFFGAVHTICRRTAGQSAAGENQRVLSASSLTTMTLLNARRSEDRSQDV